MVFVANNQSSIVLEPCKESLDFPATSIASQFSTILGVRFFPSSPVRCNHFNIAFIKKSLVKAIAIIGLITDEFIRGILGKATVYRRLNQFHFMGRSAFNVSGDRNTRSVCDCHDLGTFAALCLADSKTPFFAGAKLPSMNASRISTLPRSYRSSASTCAIFWKTPCRTQRWKRLWQVWYGGYLCGKSFQGAPVRKIHKIPFKTSRGSRSGLPLGSLDGVKSSIIGAIRSHCSFVISILIIFHIQDVMSSFL